MCSPSKEIYREHVLYNFSEEGFLASNLVQTAGSAPLPESHTGVDGNRRACIQDALSEAKERMLTIFIHTRFRIPSRGSAIEGGSSERFKSDYPYTFSDTDYLRAEINFLPFLDAGFVALADTRSHKECFVVFRIMQEDLAHKIRSTHVDFEPEGYRSRNLSPHQERFQENQNSKGPFKKNDPIRSGANQKDDDKQE